MISIKQVSQLQNHQQGAVLIFALLIMLLTGIISSTVMRTGILEVKMVSNSQFKEEAFQTTDAILNAVTANQANFVVAGDVGFKVCPLGASDTSCNSTSISVPTEITGVPSTVNLNYYMVRKGPLLSPLPIRQQASTASSASSFNIATFEVVAEYDGREAGFGHQVVYQGVGIKVASSAQ